MWITAFSGWCDVFSNNINWTFLVTVYQPCTSAWRDFIPFLSAEQHQLRDVGWFSCPNCLLQVQLQHFYRIEVRTFVITKRLLFHSLTHRSTFFLTFLPLCRFVQYVCVSGLWAAAHAGLCCNLSPTDLCVFAFCERFMIPATIFVLCLCVFGQFSQYLFALWDMWYDCSVYVCAPFIDVFFSISYIWKDFISLSCFSVSSSQFSILSAPFFLCVDSNISLQITPHHFVS